MTSVEIDTASEGAFKTRIDRGVALLDEKLPGWVDRVDLDRLNLGSGCDCILGQEFANHPDVLEDGSDLDGYGVGISELLGDTDVRNAWLYGLDRRNSDEFYSDLTAAWRNVILARRRGEVAR